MAKKTKFDYILHNTTTENTVIDYGFIGGNNTIIFIKAGQDGSCNGYQNKYLNLAINLNKKYKFSVICSSNPFRKKNPLDDAMQVISDYAKKRKFDDYDVYYIGYSNGGLIGAWHGYQYEKIKRMVLVNAPLMFNFHKTKDGIRNFSGEKMILVYGEFDPSYRYTELLMPLLNDNIELKIYKGQDHHFSNNSKDFELLPELILYNKWNVYPKKNVKIFTKDGKILKGYLSNIVYSNNKKIYYIFENKKIDIKNIISANNINKDELDLEKVKNKNKEIINNTFDEANGFMKLVINKEYEKSKTISKIPLAVNSIFACELYLKVLLLNRGFTCEDVRMLSHDLKKLYINLNDTDKEKIETWIRIFSQFDLLDYLEKIKNSFQELRYVYLNEAVVEFDMEDLLDFVFKIQHYTSMEIKGDDIYKKIEEEIAN